MPSRARCLIAAAFAVSFVALQRLDRERNGVFIREANIRAH